MEYNKAKNIIERQIYDYIEKHNSDGLFVSEMISNYAHKGYISGKYTEIAAESFTVSNTNSVANEILNI